MIPSTVVGLFYTVYLATAAPQHNTVDLAWLNPAQMMNIQQSRPSPIPEIHSESYRPPTYQPAQYESLTSASGADQDGPYLALEPAFLEYRATPSAECDPRRWLQRTTCYNATMVQTCTLAGTYRFQSCPKDWSCIYGLGMCLRTFRLPIPFKCPSNQGYYPDPYTCRMYHVCEDGSAPTNVTCFWPQVYDPVTTSCQMESPNTPCYQFKCIGLNKVAYPGNPNIYASCTGGNTIDTLNRCQWGYGFNDRTQSCEKHYCLKEGNIPADNCNQFYSCSRIYRKLIRSDLQTCIGGMYFNETTGICLPDTDNKCSASKVSNNSNQMKVSAKIEENRREIPSLDQYALLSHNMFFQPHQIHEHDHTGHYFSPGNSYPMTPHTYM